MRRSTLAVAAGLLFLAVVTLPTLTWASSIGGGGLAAQLGARLSNPQTAPAVRAGVTYDCVVVDANKAIQMGLSGARIGDKVKISIGENSQVTATLVPAPTTVARSDGGGARTTTTLNLKYDSAGKLSIVRR